MRRSAVSSKRVHTELLWPGPTHAQVRLRPIPRRSPECGSVWVHYSASSMASSSVLTPDGGALTPPRTSGPGGLSNQRGVASPSLPASRPVEGLELGGDGSEKLSASSVNRILTEFFMYFLRAMVLFYPVYLTGYLGLSVSWLLLCMLMVTWWKKNRQWKDSRIGSAIDFVDNEKQVVSTELKNSLQMASWVRPKQSYFSSSFSWKRQRKYSFEGKVGRFSFLKHTHVIPPPPRCAFDTSWRATKQKRSH